MNGIRIERPGGVNSAQRNSALDQYVRSEQYMKDRENAGVENVSTEKTSASSKAENGSKQKKEGSIYDPNGTLKKKDGSGIYNPDGTLKSEDEKRTAGAGKTGEIVTSENSHEKETVHERHTKHHMKKDGFDGDCPECECETCKRRRYMDSSDDGAVSFKNPTKIDKSMIHSRVMAHEMEHVRHEQIDAKAENRKIISQSVRIKNGICPECGETYVAGGVTRTVSRPDLSDFRKLFHVGADPVLPKDGFFEKLA